MTQYSFGEIKYSAEFVFLFSDDRGPTAETILKTLADAYNLEVFNFNGKFFVSFKLKEAANAQKES